MSLLICIRGGGTRAGVMYDVPTFGTLGRGGLGKAPSYGGRVRYST